MSIPSLPGLGDPVTWHKDPADYDDIDAESIRETAAGATPIDGIGRSQERVIGLLLDDGALKFDDAALEAELLQNVAATLHDGSWSEAMQAWMTRKFEDCAAQADPWLERRNARDEALIDSMEISQ